MKITFLVHSLFQGGGAERQLALLARGLHRHGNEVTVVCYSDKGELAPALNASGVPVIALHKAGAWDVVRFNVRLIQAIRQLNPDILYSFLIDANVMSANLKRIFPNLAVVWGLRNSGQTFGLFGRLEYVRFRLAAWLSHLPALIIHNSEAGRAFYAAEGFSDRQAIVIGNGIDTEKFQPDPSSRKRLRAELEIPSEQLVIGIVARLHPEKGHETFLRAAASFVTQSPAVRFLIVGPGYGAYVEHLQGLVQDLNLVNCVMWLGKRGDIEAVYNTFDISTLSSSYGEGFPNSVAEAMATGIPCVVTDNGDAARLVGKTGVVVQPDDPEALAKGWHRLTSRLKEDRSAIAEQCRSRIVTNFSEQRLIDRTYRAFQRLQEQQ